MKTLDQIPPVKRSEHTHIQRMFLKWHRYWLKCKDPIKRKRLFEQTMVLGNLVGKELEKE